MNITLSPFVVTRWMALPSRRDQVICLISMLAEVADVGLRVVPVEI
jgi:hypothetical protein